MVDVAQALFARLGPQMTEGALAAAFRLGHGEPATPI
jgi:hypothetical protein